MLGMGVTEIQRLSQDEGMYDHEIALILGLDRSTVTRNRLKHKIPRAYLGNRKDKVAYCTKCGTRFIIRRRESRNKCYNCVPLVDGVDTIVKEVKRWKIKEQ